MKEISMKRRRFLAVSGALATSAPCVLNGLVRAAEQTDSAADIRPDDLARAALEHFLPGKRTCSESILLAGCEALGVKSDLIPDIGLGLAGGMGLQGKTCGVISASAMVLALAVASRETDYGKKKTRVLKAVGALCRRFEEQFGTTECRKLSGLDLTTPEGRKELGDHVKAEKCRNYVEACAKILAQTLQEA
jgi:C_GCAxxG_C_C family probable redox protein